MEPSQALDSVDSAVAMFCEPGQRIPVVALWTPGPNHSEGLAKKSYTATQRCNLDDRRNNEIRPF